MAVDGVRAQDRCAALERFAELDGKPDGLAAQGLATATAGFREHAIAALFVDPDEVAGSVLWRPRGLWLVDDELRGEFNPLDDGIGVVLRHELAR
jgi:hypothetical protein